MNGIGWITVAEAARLCGTDELRITLWMNGNHIAYARFDGILMIDGASLAALFSRNRVATIYEDVAQQRGKPGRPGRLRRLLDTPLDAFGLSQRIVRACRELGVRAVVIRADVADAAACDAMVAQVLEQLGRLDILVNNAGITRDGLMLRMPEADWDAVLDTNLKGAFHCMRAAYKTMMRQKSGRVVNISSVVGLRGNAGQTNYSASKAGLIGLSKSLAKELATRNVTVNVVAPGFITTDMTDALPEGAREALLSTIPMKRLGAAEDVDRAVAFFAGEGAGYVTGQVLCVDGGMAV